MSCSRCYRQSLFMHLEHDQKVEGCPCWHACRWSGDAGALLRAAAEGTTSAAVTCERCDTSSQEEAAALLASYDRRKGCKGIAGLLLSGGVLSDAVLGSQTPGTFSILPDFLPLWCL